MVEDKDLAVEPEYYHTHWKEREKLIRLIQKEVGLVDSRMLTCHGFAIFSCKVLESLYNKFLIPRNMTYIDLMRISPYEFSWYNMWLQEDKTIPIEIKEPIIKFFHHANHHLDFLRKDITIKDMARSYIGYNINSNYSRGYGVVSYDTTHNPRIYEKELSVTEIFDQFIKLLCLLFMKIKRKILNLRLNQSN